MISLSKTQTNYVYFIFIAVFFLSFTFSNNNIILKGKINSKARYSIDVVYEAGKDDFFCTNWNPFGSGLSRKQQYYKYLPDINDNKHYISIPVDEMFFSFCDYKVKQIEMNMNLGKTLLFAGGENLAYVNRPIKQSFIIDIKDIYLIKVEGNEYTLDIGVVNRHLNNLKLKKETISITERIKKKKALWKNYIVFLEVFFILCIFFIPFILIHFDKAKANKKEKPKTSRLLWFALLVITIFTIYLIDTLFIYYKTYSI